MIRIPLTSKTTNETVVKEAIAKRTLANDIRKRKGKFFGHFMRRRGLEHLAITGKINGQRSRRRLILEYGWELLIVTPLSESNRYGLLH